MTAATVLFRVAAKPYIPATKSDHRKSVKENRDAF
jgi:hypothetical protein